MRPMRVLCDISRPDDALFSESDFAVSLTGVNPLQS